MLRRKFPTLLLAHPARAGSSRQFSRFAVPLPPAAAEDDAPPALLDAFNRLVAEASDLLVACDSAGRALTCYGDAVARSAARLRAHPPPHVGQITATWRHGVRPITSRSAPMTSGPDAFGPGSSRSASGLRGLTVPLTQTGRA
ncbi:MAG: hypothetical protein H6701_00785 [Myxococcales bacterium]|nr:hypothetical protein [Myxococcales bacterium]